MTTAQAVRALILNVVAVVGLVAGYKIGVIFWDAFGPERR